MSEQEDIKITILKEGYLEVFPDKNDENYTPVYMTLGRCALSFPNGRVESSRDLSPAAEFALGWVDPPPTDLSSQSI